MYLTFLIRNRCQIQIFLITSKFLRWMTLELKKNEKKILILLLSAWIPERLTTSEMHYQRNMKCLQQQTSKQIAPLTISYVTQIDHLNKMMFYISWILQSEYLAQNLTLWYNCTGCTDLIHCCMHYFCNTINVISGTINLLLWVKFLKSAFFRWVGRNPIPKVQIMKELKENWNLIHQSNITCPCR